jgi:hypothetical protein
MPGPNLLIGNGEVLAGTVLRDGRVGGTKAYPYSIQEARERLREGIAGIADALDQLPDAAKPRGEGTGLITVHPAFLAKTQMPSAVFRRAGLRTLGSRPASVTPEKDARVSAPSGPQPAAELYVSGTSEAFRQLGTMLMSDATAKTHQDEFCRLEAVRFLDPTDRLVRLEGQDAQVPIEVVLHGDSGDAVLLDAFEAYAIACGVQLGRKKLLGVPGLVFMPGTAPRSDLAKFASFTALRAVRRLPVLRLNRPVIRQRLTVQAPALPDADALDSSLKVVVFDGGLGARDFSRWCEEIVPAELGATHADYLSHGTEVTSALLFGAVEHDATMLPRPYFDVVHHRALGLNDEQDVDLYDCMRRINEVLQAGDVDFANLSLGPRLAIDDGQPHAWTAMLDGHLAQGRTLMTVAAGNDGNLPEGMGRIQPPADAVNALSVGAADSREFMWGRAPYSCYGPGRSPGLVKPDGVAFGGTEQQPLVLLNPLAGGLTGVQGTSFASPLALRTAASARAVSATALSATTLRALMIHRADRAQGHDARDVGWGRFPESADELLTCGDNEVCVIYQGHIEAGGTMRIGIPVPPVALGVGLTVKATFCFASPVDPADPINYTRHGLTVVFRPRGAGSSAPFFSTGNYDSEQDLRADAYKWETVLHKTANFAADQLLDACFDVDHGAREHGLKVDNSAVPPLPYVLIATVSTQKGEPIYQSIMQKYRALAPIQLRERVQLRGR